MKHRSLVLFIIIKVKIIEDYPNNYIILVKHIMVMIHDIHFDNYKWHLPTLFNEKQPSHKFYTVNNNLKNLTTYP